MNRRISDFLVYVCMALVLALHFLTGWLAAPDAGKLLTSGLPAMLAILVCAVPLYFIHQWMLSGSSMVTVLFYVFLAAANPVSFTLSRFHGIAILLVCCLYCYLCFSVLRPSLDYAAGFWLSFGIASLLLPSLLWLAPILLLSTIRKAADKGRYIFLMLTGLLLPAAVWMALRFLRGNPLSPGDLLSACWSGLVTLHLPSTRLTAATLVRIGFTVLMTATAFWRILPRLSRFKTAQYDATLRLMLLTLCFSAHAVLFLDYPVLPAGLLVMLPTAPLLSVFLLDTLSRRGTLPWFVTLLLLLAAERISFFVNL